jgi:hypothetical protein
MSASQALDMPNEATPDHFGTPPSPPTETNIWSIVMDVKFPVLTGYSALWETTTPPGTSDDADYFIRDDSGTGSFGSIGTSGQYGGFFEANTWYRVAVTVDAPVSGGGYKVNSYIDGVWTAVEATTSTVPDGKEAVEAILHLFTDQDGETAAGIINSLAFYDVVLTESEIAALGGASAAGIPVVLPPGVPGDYNENGTVDAADYTKWRDNLGAAIALPNEGAGITPGSVTTEDYVFWKTNFGNSGAGSGSALAGGSSVPEPTGWVLAILALLVGVAKRSRG